MDAEFVPDVRAAEDTRPEPSTTSSPPPDSSVCSTMPSTARPAWLACYDPTDSSITKITLLDCGVSADNTILDWWRVAISAPTTFTHGTNQPAASYTLASAQGRMAVNFHLRMAIDRSRS